MERCGAKKHQGGDPCRKPAGWGVPGVNVGRCKLHGGLTPSHRQASNRELARQALERYGVAIPIDPAAALLQEVARSYGAVVYLEARVAELAELWGPTFHVSGIATGEAKPHVSWVMLMAERKHHADVCRDALRAGVEARAIELAEDTARQVAGVLAEFAKRLGLDPGAPEVRSAGRAALEVVAGGRGDT